MRRRSTCRQITVVEAEVDVAEVDVAEVDVAEGEEDVAEVDVAEEEAQEEAVMAVVVEGEDEGVCFGGGGCVVRCDACVPRWAVVCGRWCS